MSDSRAYTYDVGPDPAYGADGGIDDGLVNQSSPTWVLTFVRWKYRDTLRISNSITNGGDPNSSLLTQLKSVEETLVVRNDCINVSVTSSKSSYTPSMEAILLQTDVDYLTEVAPGDFVFVNILNWEDDAEDVASRADDGQQPINNVDDGFKGFFKVQSVRERLAVTNTQTGAKTRVVSITGYAFTEFNSLIYFNQAVALQNPIPNFRQSNPPKMGGPNSIWRCIFFEEFNSSISVSFHRNWYPRHKPEFFSIISNHSQ